MIRLVVCDIDGTLIGPDEIVSDDTVKLTKQLAQKGVYFTLATGRVECSAQKFADQLHLQIPYVACNGATVVGDSGTLKRLQIPVSPLRAMIEFADEQHVSITYAREGNLFAWRETPYVLDQKNRFGRAWPVHRFTESEWNTVHVDKCTFWTTDDDAAIAHIEDLCRNMPGIVGYTRYQNRSVEVVHPEATKKSGVEFLASNLSVPMDELMFVGDHQNDIELIQAAGVGVAVSNATPEVKRTADYVCRNPESRGVREAVDAFVLEQ